MHVLIANSADNDMKILLQHARTQLYLRNLGNWTANPFEAYDFRHSQRAIEFAREHAITGVQIVVKVLLDGPEDVYALPVLPKPAARVAVH